MGRQRMILVLAGAIILGGLVTAPASAEPSPLPSRIRSIRHATQAIVVSSATWHSTRADVRIYERVKGRWRLVRGPMPGRIGRNGFSAPGRRHEGDRTTPAGTFGFVYGFGSRPDPGVRGFKWRPLKPGACWSGKRADYNRWVRRACTRHDENLWKYRKLAYRYSMVIDFNYAHPVYGKGSGIFLHQQTGRATLGCVALREADLVAVLRWMRPGVRIVMGPTSFVRRQ
jgi:L,D-peptidoglycan transpeptidase YkuD (ErfK/YbiS/YcfS/YnhG family)